MERIDIFYKEREQVQEECASYGYTEARKEQTITNRDKINGMSNAMMADILSRVDIAYDGRCKFCINIGRNCSSTDWDCFYGIKAWLDAPVKKS